MLAIRAGNEAETNAWLMVALEGCLFLRKTEQPLTTLSSYQYLLSFHFIANTMLSALPLRGEGRYTVSASFGRGGGGLGRAAQELKAS